MNKLSRLPSTSGNRIVFPVHKVKKLAAIQLGIQYRLDLKFIFTSNNERTRIRRGTTGDKVRPFSFKETDMKNGMDSYGLGQVKSIGPGTNFFQDSKRTNTLIVKFTSGSTGV